MFPFIHAKKATQTKSRQVGDLGGFLGNAGHCLQIFW